MAKRKIDDPKTAVPRKITRLNMSSISCKVCRENIDLTISEDISWVLSCRECSDRYHGPCVGVSSNLFFNLIHSSDTGWACYNCIQNKMNFIDNIEERVTSIESTVDRNSATISNIQASVNAAIQIMSDKITTVQLNLRQEMEEIRSNAAASGTNSISSLPTSNASPVDFNYINSLQRRNNLFIQNIPVVVGETPQSLKVVVIKLAAAYGYDLLPEFISIVIRLRGKSSTSDQLNVRQILERPFVNALLVKLTDSSVKDDFFKKYIAAVTQKQFVTGTNIGIQSNRRIYINHHLTPELSAIKVKASELKANGVISKIHARYDCVKVLVRDTWIKVTNIEALSQIEEMQPNN